MAKTKDTSVDDVQSTEVEAGPAPEVELLGSPTEVVTEQTFYTYKDYHGLQVYDTSITQAASEEAPANSTTFVPPVAKSPNLIYWTGHGWMVGLDIEKVPIAELQQKFLNQATSVFNQRVTELNAQYPRLENSKWVQMAQEARLYLQNRQETPFLSALATAKGTTVEDVSLSIVSKADAYDKAYGKLLGEFQVERARVATVKSLDDLKPFRVTDLWVGPDQ